MRQATRKRCSTYSGRARVSASVITCATLLFGGGLAFAAQGDGPGRGRPIAQVTTSTLTVDEDGESVRLINNTALPLRVSAPSIIQPSGTTNLFTAATNVFDATVTPPKSVGSASEIPVGGYLEVIVEFDGAGKADAELRIAVSTGTNRPDRGRRGRVFSVVLRANAPAPAQAAPIPTTDIKTLTVQRTTTVDFKLAPWPFGLSSEVEGDQLPVAFTGECSALKKLPKANLSSDKADSARITTSCDGDGDDKLLQLTVVGVSRSGATYDGSLRLGADKDTDVAVKVLQRVDPRLAFFAVLLGVGLGLTFQRRTKITATVRRLRAEIDGLRADWAIETVPTLTLTDAVSSLKAELSAAVDRLSRQHLISLSDTDPDVAALNADIGAVRKLEGSWDAFSAAAKQLKFLISLPAPKVDGITGPGGLPQVYSDAAAVLTRTDAHRQGPLTIEELPELDKRVRAHIQMVVQWMDTAKRIQRLYAEVTDAEPRRTLGEKYGLLWEADTSEKLTEIDDAVVDLSGGLIDVRDNLTAALGGWDHLYAGARLNLFSGGDSGRRELSAAEMDAWLEKVAQASHQFRTHAIEKWRAWTFTFVSWGLVLVAVLAVAWTGYEKTWLSATTLGWMGLLTAFFWGLVTPSVLDLAASAIDRLRSGARVYYARTQVAGD